MPNILGSLMLNLLPYCKLDVESPTDNRWLRPHKRGHLFIRKNHYCLSGFVMMGSFMLFCFEKKQLPRTSSAYLFHQDRLVPGLCIVDRHYRRNFVCFLLQHEHQTVQSASKSFNDSEILPKLMTRDLV